MRLNKKGFAPWSLLIAVAAVAVFVLLTIPGTNEYADVPPMKATSAAVSDNGKVKLKAGEEFKILGVDKTNSNRDGGTRIMLLVQTSKGERALFNPDLISDEKMQEILPAVKKHDFSNSPALFCRKTITRKAVDAIPLGISLEQMDSILVPTDRAVMEDGFLKAEYLRMEVFDKGSGRFYKPVMKFQNGEYCGCELVPYRKTHLNAWLLKILPGAEWVYDHNVFNIDFQKKAFGKLALKDAKEVTLKDNFFEYIMVLAVAILLLVIVFAFYVFIPMLPAYTFYGLMLFPPLFKPFSEKMLSIVVTVLAVLGYYYCWLTFMPYMSFFIMPFLMYPAATLAIEPLLGDALCSKCRYMNYDVLDHTEFLGEHYTNRVEDKRRKVGSRKVATRQTWKETTTTTKNSVSGQILNQYTNKSDVKNYTDYEDTYRTDSYACKYLVKSYRDYYRCEVCGTITYSDRDEWELVSKDHIGTSTSTSNRTVVS